MSGNVGQASARERPPKATYKCIIAYDGTGFAGFQRLSGDQRTVQGVLESALRAIGWEESRLLAAGRTDRGAHARGQVISFGLIWAHSPAALMAALNARLPDDVAIRRTEAAYPGFHPRFGALSRRYTYSAFFDPAPDPLRERYAWRVWPEPDPARLSEAARRLPGRRDFGAFGRSPVPQGNTVRSIFRAGWEGNGGGGRFEIEADAFLQHMIRRLAAAMMTIGLGRASPDSLQSSLDDPARQWPGILAPACGLCLEGVLYPAEMPDGEIET